MTLGELRKLTEHLSDDTLIITTSVNYELNGSMVESGKIRLIKAGKRNKSFRDDFDGTSYTKEIYVYDDEEGEDVLYI